MTGASRNPPYGGARAPAAERAPSTARRWTRLEQMFHVAAALAPAERSAFLERACADDPSLRAEVERLLAADARAGGFIETPALADAGSRPEGAAEPGAMDRMYGPYRIVREIARGGMGAVYLAERADGQFERRVAIKLIRHGMDLDLVLRRFRAERQILASLEHPSIARLLDGGTDEDDRPYFVMEYIDGEPIDAYCAARHLSVPERLRLFLQVCDAVAYAHARRVIHRDIKPANILVTADGAPRLLDFGIAKVLEPGAEEATSAVTGLRLLTPEYASPEQVDGHAATEASDVYSLGVVLYELLTGRSPYRPRGRDPLSVAEAVRTTHPERPSIAVMRTGEDAESGRRTGGGASTRARRATGREAIEAAALRRQLRGDLDVIVLTALRKEPERRYASVEQMAEDIRRHLAAQPVRARPDTLRYRASKFVRRNRAAVIAAGITALAFLLLGAGFLALRPSGPPSLVATGALGPRDRILVAGFTDGGGDPQLAQTLAAAFRTDLAQSPLVQVLAPEQVREALVRMQRDPDAALDDSLAHEVAVREGAKAIVTGAVGRIGSAYTIGVQLVGAERGEVLTGVRETAADSTELIAAVDRASKALRRRIGESLAELRDMPPLEQATTASLPALRRYSAGYRSFLAGERTRALRLYEEAVALDTAFAAAWYGMSAIYHAMAEPGRAEAALRDARANRDRLPFLERQRLVASSAYASGDYRTAVAEYDRLLERYPNDLSALNNQALAYRDWRRYAEAERLWRRAIALDSTISVLYYGLHSAQALRGEFAASRATLERIGRRFPDDPVLPVVVVQDAAARQSWDEAERLALANIALTAGDTLRLVDAYEALAGIVMTRGRLEEAERHWRTQLALSAASGSAGRHLFGAQQLGYLVLRFRGRPNAARALLDSTLAAHPLEGMLRGDRPYHDLARFYAAAGDVPRACALLAAADSNDRALGRTRAADRDRAQGVIALAEGRARDAQELLRRAVDVQVCEICALPDLARADEAAGDLDAALVAYERYLATPWLWRYETDAHELGHALRRTAELYERRGDRERAAAAYARLLRLWDGADGLPAREAQEARRRLADLESAEQRTTTAGP